MQVQVVSQDEFVAKKSNLFFKCHICVDHDETTSIKTFVWEDSSFTEQSTEINYLIGVQVVLHCAVLLCASCGKYILLSVFLHSLFRKKGGLCSTFRPRERLRWDLSTENIVDKFQFVIFLKGRSKISLENVKTV